MRTGSTLFLAFVVCAAGASAQNAAWFGTTVPPGVSDPRKPIMR